MLARLFRTVFTIFGVIVGYGVFLMLKDLAVAQELEIVNHFTYWGQIGVGTTFAIIFGIIFYKMAPFINRQSKVVTENIERSIQSISPSDILLWIIGLVLGLVIAFLISFTLYGTFNYKYIDFILTIVTYIVTIYLCIVIVTKKGREVFAILTKNTTAPRPKSRKLDQSCKILDTSVIIDGRILDLLKTGFIEGDIIIPEFVLLELQQVADSSDSLKRNRGRRGLDILKQIRVDFDIDIYPTNGDKALKEIPDVDIKLLKLAKDMKGKVVTNDYNLNKVASIKGVDVLNINELSNAIKPIVLPGENMNLFVVKEGKESNQGIGYLDDGTMIVVQEGRKYIGKNINVLVTSTLQTAAGRMIFVKPDL